MNMNNDSCISVVLGRDGSVPRYASGGLQS